MTAFDDYCGFWERQGFWRSLFVEDRVEDARRTVDPRRCHLVSIDEVREFDMPSEEEAHYFFLPLNPVAVVSDEFFVILGRLPGDEEVIGFPYGRYVVCVVGARLPGGIRTFFSVGTLKPAPEDSPTNHVQAYEMSAFVAWDRKSKTVIRRVDGEAEDLDDAGRDVAELSGNFARVALGVITEFNEPANIVVEIEPKARPRKGKPTDRVLRTHQRTRFVALPRRTLRKIVSRDTTVKRKLKTAHWRRRHWRRLTADRFVAKKGRYVLVRECVVGSTEFEVGNATYKVRLDIAGVSRNLVQQGAPE